MPQTLQPFKVGDAVRVDDRFDGEIIEHLWNDYFRVEVATEKERHEFWTVSASRLLLEDGK